MGNDSMGPGPARREPVTLFSLRRAAGTFEPIKNRSRARLLAPRYGEVQ
jgi:hypothetical protein